MSRAQRQLLLLVATIKMLGLPRRLERRRGPPALVDYPVHRAPFAYCSVRFLLSLGPSPAAPLIYAGVQATFPTLVDNVQTEMRIVGEIGYVSPSTGAMPQNISSKQKCGKLATGLAFLLARLRQSGQRGSGGMLADRLGYSHARPSALRIRPNIAQEMNRAKV